jgi:hypothetical protein
MGIGGAGQGKTQDTRRQTKDYLSHGKPLLEKRIERSAGAKGCSAAFCYLLSPAIRRTKRQMELAPASAIMAADTKTAGRHQPHPTEGLTHRLFVFSLEGVVRPAFLQDGCHRCQEVLRYLGIHVVAATGGPLSR